MDDLKRCVGFYSVCKQQHHRMERKKVLNFLDQRRGLWLNVASTKVAF
jgi:hypothetical protein